MTSNNSENSLDWAKEAYALLKKKQELEKEELKKPIDSPPDLISPVLGDFDDDFTWSAMVLAAQGKKASQVSIDEIDWLSKLKRGLEETRKGLVTELLEKLGDDPLTP